MLKLETLSKEDIKEITELSNNKNYKQIKESYDYGCLEVYPDLNSFKLKSGFDYTNYEMERFTSILKSGKLIWFE